MAIHLRGVIRGQKIELETDPGLPTGSRVSVTIDGNSRTAAERRRALKKLYAVWKRDPSIAAAFEGIIADRLRSEPRPTHFDAAS